MSPEHYQIDPLAFMFLFTRKPLDYFQKVRIDKICEPRPVGPISGVRNCALHASVSWEQIRPPPPFK